jgi:3-dehydroquinate synthase
MMRTLKVSTGERTYPIFIGSGLLNRLPELLRERGIGPDRPLLLVTDTQVAPLYGEKVTGPLRAAGYRVRETTVPAGESSKSLDQLSRLVGEGLRFGLDRQGAVLALGGGVVGDLAGFLAASYMRGIPFVQLPTTLLAHDSSVGGKVGVNHPLGKNVIGAFHQPVMVVFDVDTLRTLPFREVVSGYAEVVKHALIAEESFADWLLRHCDGLLRLEPFLVEEAIWNGCRIKAEVVSKDERETGLRAILNYGHTIGHALEAASGYTGLTHGEGVAIGMVGAAMLGEALETARDVVEPTKRLLTAFRLPVQLAGDWSEEELMALMRRDKKVRGGAYTFVLPERIGAVRVVRGIPEEKILRVLRKLRAGSDTKMD